MCIAQHYYHHQSLNQEGRLGTTDDFATSFLHFPLFSTALWDLQNSGLSIPWCCFPTYSSVCLVFFPLSLCLARLVLARPDERETWPYHCSLRLFTIVRRSSCGPIACWILAQHRHRLCHTLYLFCRKDWFYPTNLCAWGVQPQHRNLNKTLLFCVCKSSSCYRDRDCTKDIIFIRSNPVLKSDPKLFFPPVACTLRNVIRRVRKLISEYAFLKCTELRQFVRRQIGRRLDNLTRRDTTYVLVARERTVLNIQHGLLFSPRGQHTASETQRELHSGQPKSNARVEWCGYASFSHQFSQSSVPWGRAARDRHAWPTFGWFDIAVSIFGMLSGVHFDLGVVTRLYCTAVGVRSGNLILRVEADALGQLR